MRAVITYDKRDVHSRGLWLMAEKSLGGPVRMVAAMGTSVPWLAKYYFRRQDLMQPPITLGEN